MSGPETNATRRDRSSFSWHALGRELEPLLYWAFAGSCTLWVACLFYSSLRLQTEYSRLWARPDLLDAAVRGPMPALWSAPLDDVFIHFDFARSAARGHPFEWSQGTGYSSGATSLLYPFVLALGYRLGFVGLSLMMWAALVAQVSVLATLLAMRRLCTKLPRYASYLLPPGFLCVGALDWSLFSGMEVALFLALWSAAFLVWDDLWAERSARASALLWRSGLLGLLGVLLVATRPEGAAAQAVLALGAALATRGRAKRLTLVVGALAFAPTSVFLVVQALVNRHFTGDFSAAGALTKLEIYHPFLSARQVWEAWLFHLKYQALRVTQYHFSDVPALGWIAWALALVPLWARQTRPRALLLWASLVAWTVVVAFNGQVRWQNERYAMPAVAWLLLLAALGLAVLVSLPRLLERRRLAIFLTVLGLAAAALFERHELPRFREQVWFFGRASRNILDQQLRVGAILRTQIEPKPRRVLVGDAGAIAYASDLPALDIIGLGGYRDLPFARASRIGVAAAIELIERMPDRERPDMMAIYPSWWKDLPLWFGTRVGEVPVRGNVICGGLNKVLYRTHWQALDRGARPFSLAAGERVLDGVDFGDLVSEKQHGYALSQAHVGNVVMRLLPDPSDPTHDLWDAGRVVPPGVSERFELRHLSAARELTLIVRSAPAMRCDFDVLLEGRAIGHVTLDPGQGWTEARVALRAALPERAVLTLAPAAGERVLYHLWAVAR